MTIFVIYYNLISLQATLQYGAQNWIELYDSPMHIEVHTNIKNRSFIIIYFPQASAMTEVRLYQCHVIRKDKRHLLPIRQSQRHDSPQIC